MTDAIEGRWWFDSARRPAADPASNEFFLKAGQVSITEVGEPDVENAIRNAIDDCLYDEIKGQRGLFSLDRSERSR